MSYCKQNDGDCAKCSLVNYGRDCQNNAVAVVDDGRCQCGRPVIHCDTHWPNYAAADAARLDACRRNDPSHGVKTAESIAFFGE